MFGAVTFSANAKGMPTMSRSMLIKRLDELERAGAVEHDRNPTAAATFISSPKRAPTSPRVIFALAAWGERWIKVTTGRSDPGFTLWA